MDLIRHRTRAPSLRAALDEARAFLALEPAPDRDPGAAPATGRGSDYDATEAARRLWRQCRAIAGTGSRPAACGGPGADRTPARPAS